MISDVTIGQYFPGESVIHKLDPRIKIVLTTGMIISVFLCKNFVSLGICFAMTLLVVLTSKINMKAIFNSVKPLLVIIVITAILNIFYGTGEPLLKFWIFKITQEGIINAIFMSFRIFLFVVIGSMLTYTTSPTSLTDAIESLLKPLKIFKVDVHSFAMVMTIALRFIPTLLDEIQKITNAQKSRGADFESGNIFIKIKSFVPVLIPLFVSSFRHANELAYAMECRCYRGGNGRTKMKVNHIKLIDYISLLICITYIISLPFINHYIGKIV